MRGIKANINEGFLPLWKCKLPLLGKSHVGRHLVMRAVGMLTGVWNGSHIWTPTWKEGMNLASSGEAPTDSVSLGCGVSWISIPVGQPTYQYFLPFRNNNGIDHCWVWSVYLQTILLQIEKYSLGVCCVEIPLIFYLNVSRLCNYTIMYLVIMSQV